MRTAHQLSRRHFLATTAAVAAVGFPAIVRSQPKEIVIGGAASHKAFMDPTVIPMFEKKYDCKIIFEGTKSLVNLEKTTIDFVFDEVTIPVFFVIAFPALAGFIAGLIVQHRREQQRQG